MEKKLNESELLINMFDWITKTIEINKIEEERTIAVKEQNYELAVNLRDKERRLRADLPSFESMKILRDKIAQENGIKEYKL
jgi:hypothetical protein